MIITEGSRGSGESRVFEQRRESSPVVQSCKRVDTSEETTPAEKKRRQTGNQGEKRVDTRAAKLESTLESNSYRFYQLLKFCCGVLTPALCFELSSCLSEMFFFLSL